MARPLLVLCTLSVVLALVACGSPGQKPGPDQPAPNAPPAERVVALLESLASQLQAADSDCEQVATRLAAWTDSNAEQYGQISRDAATSELAEPDRSRYQGRLRAAFDAIIEASRQCASHQGAQAAFARFDVLVDPE